MVKLLRQVADDSSIKGVIVRVDSPGGDGIASDDILHEMKLLSKKKPVLISMSDLAASGGYFIAMTGDPVLAYSNTLTGSIGVFFGKVNLSGLVRQDRPQERTAHARALRGHRFGEQALDAGGKGQGSERDPGVLPRALSSAWPKRASGLTIRWNRWRRGVCGWERRPR